MNILLVNHYAGSPYHGMGFRPYYLGQEWIKQGHKLYIVAGSYSHIRRKNPDIGDNKYKIENIDGIEYIMLAKMNVRCNCIIINQCDCNDYFEKVIDGQHVRIFLLPKEVYLRVEIWHYEIVMRSFLELLMMIYTIMMILIK